MIFCDLKRYRRFPCCIVDLNYISRNTYENFNLRLICLIFESNSATGSFHWEFTREFLQQTNPKSSFILSHSTGTCICSLHWQYVCLQLSRFTGEEVPNYTVQNIAVVCTFCSTKIHVHILDTFY